MLQHTRVNLLPHPTTNYLLPLSAPKNTLCLLLDPNSFLQLPTTYHYQILAPPNYNIQQTSDNSLPFNSIYQYHSTSHYNLLPLKIISYNTPPLPIPYHYQLPSTCTNYLTQPYHCLLPTFSSLSTPTKTFYKKTHCSAIPNHFQQNTTVSSLYSTPYY